MHACAVDSGRRFQCAHGMKFLSWQTGGGFTVLLLAALLLGVQRGHAAEEAAAHPLLLEAEKAFRGGEPAKAISLAGQVIKAEPKNTKALALRGRFYEDTRDHVRAIADFDAVLKLDPKAALIYQHRGSEHFKAGHFKESLADFDQFLTLVPGQAAQHWQRGISCYYAGKFQEGRQQFELHQSVNPNDVENAVWHFLCVARAASLTEARAALIPISGDSRVPMMQVHALFGGKGSVEEVLAAAGAGPAARRNEQLFYAHLYLGLYYEASGDARRAREHILKAADTYKSDHYMGDVARVHAALLRKAAK